jgi:hypothetical protein
MVSTLEHVLERVRSLMAGGRSMRGGGAASSGAEHLGSRTDSALRNGGRARLARSAPAPNTHHIAAGARAAHWRAARGAAAATDATIAIARARAALPPLVSPTFTARPPAA